jgi:hypothetical protein
MIWKEMAKFPQDPQILYADASSQLSVLNQCQLLRVNRAAREEELSIKTKFCDVPYPSLKERRRGVLA